ncbi:4365_t:CDS:2, partial [Ambispora leptoticha]
IPDDMPEYYQKLMIYCWASDPSKRPTANEIFNTIREWDYPTVQNKVEEIDQFPKLLTHTLHGN